MNTDEKQERQNATSSGNPAPSKVFSTFPGAGNTAPIPTTDERPAMTILPELRDHPQYEVLRELGRGGMGVVYLAKNKLMDRQEVLKVVNKQLLGEAGAAERFLREIRSAAQLNHPNIVTAYSALQVGDALMFSMEYIEGRDLAQVVKVRGPLPATHCGSYVLQAARGLQHAFEKGMVHRDIKPQNLILDGKTNIVKILDFGLAKATTRTADAAAEGLTGLNMMMGTPDYMAPEQARDAANVDIRADIYSLGCTLYFLLAGRAPFVGGSLATKIAAHQLSEPDPVESLRTDLPPGLAEIVRKMMAKDPAKRYQQPEEVVQALTVCFKGKGKQPTAKAPPVNVKAAKPIVVPKLNIKGDGKSIYAKKTVAPIAAPLQTMKELPSPVVQVKNEKTAWRRNKWLMGAGAGVAMLLLALVGLWAAGVFKVKTKDGTIVLENLPAGAEILVDGEKVTVTWGADGKKAEIHVRPGTRKIVASRDGVEVIGEEVEIEDGKRRILTARLTTPPDGKGKQPPTEGDGYVTLFNGKDLTGWVVDSGDEHAWQVKNGELAAIGSEEDGTALRLKQGYLLTEREYSDFVLRFQFQQAATKYAASGVALRAVPHETARTSNPDVAAESDFPYHLTVVVGQFNPLNPNQAVCGSLWWTMDRPVLLAPDNLPALKQVGEWNEMEVEMRGQSLRIAVNGRDVQNVMLNKTRPQTHPAVGLSRFSGRIGFLKRVGEVRYRKIEIKELAPK
jgi:serine/threonine protein kinase